MTEVKIMRKKSLLFLLIIPFVVAILAFVTSNFVIRNVEQDITGINWSYSNNTGFSLRDEKVALNAEPIYNKDYPLAPGNELVWKVSDLPDYGQVATIEETGDNYYLKLLKDGQCTVTCSNEKGNIARSFRAIIAGDDGAIILNVDNGLSGSNLTDTFYAGYYDLSYSNVALDSYTKVKSHLNFSLSFVGTGFTSENDLIVTHSDNVSVSLQDHVINFEGFGEGYVSFKSPYAGSQAQAGELHFEIIDGVNVYNYNDLLLATNLSLNGENVVQRVNLESYVNTYKPDGTKISENTELFGNVTGKDGDGNPTYNFANEVYRFKSTYDTTFLDKWNNYVKDNPGLSPVSTDVIAGIHLKKNYYGNGYTLNMQNLAYPYVTLPTGDGYTANLNNNNLFRGPLIYIALGNPYTPVTIGQEENPDGYPLFALYGQDNIGLYVDGDNIEVVDAHIKNCNDYQNNFQNLQYTGTVVEVNGDNVNLTSSRFEYGRTVVRSYSNKDLTIEDSYLANGMEYLLKLGTNAADANHIDGNKKISYTLKDGKTISDSLSNAMTPFVNNEDNLLNGYADGLLTYGILKDTQIMDWLAGYTGALPASPYNVEDYYMIGEVLKDALTNLNGFTDNDGNLIYGNTATVDHTYFYRSGLSAICMDTLPQGPYLENNISTLFALILGMYMKIQVNNMAYTASPSHLTIKGDIRFYDWKEVEFINSSSFMYQNLEYFIGQHGGVGQVSISDDDYFPLRAMLKKYANDYFLSDGEKLYTNLPIFFMGGGYNASDVIFESENQEYLSEQEINLNMYEYSLDFVQDPWAENFNSNSEAKFSAMQVGMRRAINHVLGFNHYRFTSVAPETLAWYNQSPDISDLKK